jgi:hypothetical protein
LRQLAGILASIKAAIETMRGPVPSDSDPVTAPEDDHSL